MNPGEDAEKILAPADYSRARFARQSDCLDPGVSRRALYLYAVLTGCGKSLPAAFSHRAEAQRAAQSARIRLFARCGLAGRPFAQPAGYSGADMASELAAVRCAAIEFFRSLLSLTVCEACDVLRRTV
jgi:hypothetical protein